jgi:putative tryptophan/tyrosine transport system substrate-binding protein
MACSEEEQVMFKPFAEGMRELGYVEGKNPVFEHTFIGEKYDLFGPRAQELVDRKVDVILASIRTAAVAAAKVTKKIPIVFPSGGDPVRLGLVESLRQPGGNLTGLSLFYPELTAKHLELLRDLVPVLSRVAVLGNPTNEDYRAALDGAEWASHNLGLELVKITATSPEQFADAFAAITKPSVGGMIVLGERQPEANCRICRAGLLAALEITLMQEASSPTELAFLAIFVTRHRMSTKFPKAPGRAICRLSSQQSSRW